jgi:hypothetical protein
MISSRDLAWMQREMTSYMPTPAVVERVGVALTLTMPDGSPLCCRVDADSRQSRIEGATALEEQQRWQITFPEGTNILAGDAILALGNRYVVVKLAHPTSWDISTTVFAYMTYDDAGTPVYIRPNATVRVLRAGVQVGPDSIDVRLAAPGEQQFTDLGGERALHLLFAMGVDVRMEDDIRILTYAQVAFPRPGPYEAQDVLPVGEVGLESLRVRLIGFTL